MDRRQALKQMTFGASGALISGQPKRSSLAKLKITEVSVMAARTFNHPYEMYANFRPSVTMKAELQEGQMAEEVLYELQQAAERIVENHKQRILLECEQMYDRDESAATDELYVLHTDKIETGQSSSRTRR
jgi:hypothetical protein